MFINPFKLKMCVTSYSLGDGEFHYVLTKQNMFKQVSPIQNKTNTICVIL